MSKMFFMLYGQHNKFRIILNGVNNNEIVRCDSIKNQFKKLNKIIKIVNKIIFKTS